MQDGAGERAVPQRVWEWLTRLHALTAGASSADEAAGRVALVAPLIAGRFPLEAFTQRSLEAVAAASKFWPAYGELVERLTPWWRDHRPRPLALTPPPGPAVVPMTEAERAAMLERFAALREELAAGILAREARERPVVASLADVSLKGAHLEALRERRKGAR